MLIKQTSKYLLSLLLCIPVCAFTAPKSVDSDMNSADKVQTVKQTKATRASTANYPKRGMTMKQVRKQYGKPHSTRKSTGRVKKKWPRITVWNYAKYSVYFERHITLHTVVH
uniref:Lipoprotein SmpA/OmlA domain-containing protein n=1 Tax=uncultured Thiotrichaceae bacterium TaxID=298394 RepID=A0A6S6S691_9GAMM|nr:MAG: Unknown protein [uncultured Thiotrichaceae bacterium]